MAIVTLALDFSFFIYLFILFFGLGSPLQKNIAWRLFPTHVELLCFSITPYRYNCGPFAFLFFGLKLVEYYYSSTSSR